MLAAFVSVTDHDDIRAGIELQDSDANRRTPVSFEWTVPYGRGFFHIGVHNLPVSSAHEWFARLNAFTRHESRESLSDVFAGLKGLSGALVVFFRYLLWDLAGVGVDEHTRQLRRFLASHRSSL